MNVFPAIQPLADLDTTSPSQRDPRKLRDLDAPLIDWPFSLPVYDRPKDQRRLHIRRLLRQAEEVLIQSQVGRILADLVLHGVDVAEVVEDSVAGFAVPAVLDLVLSENRRAGDLKEVAAAFARCQALVDRFHAFEVIQCCGVCGELATELSSDWAGYLRNTYARPRPPRLRPFR